MKEFLRSADVADQLGYPEEVISAYIIAGLATSEIPVLVDLWYEHNQGSVDEDGQWVEKIPTAQQLLSLRGRKDAGKADYDPYAQHGSPQWDNFQEDSMP